MDNDINFVSMYNFRGIYDKFENVEKPKSGDLIILESDGNKYIYLASSNVLINGWRKVSHSIGEIREDVLRFIKVFKAPHKKEIEDLFTNGQCFWFAKILEHRFGGDIYYNNSDNHFACMISDLLYDIKGPISKDLCEKFIKWDMYKQTDPRNTQTIYRDCILNLGDYEIDSATNTCNDIELKIYGEGE